MDKHEILAPEELCKASISHVIDNLHICGLDAIQDSTELKKYNIEAVISLGCYSEDYQYVRKYIKELNNSQYKFIKIDDIPSADIKSKFSECIKFIDDNKDVNILVH